jgi:serine/threonine protein kinase
MQLAADVPVAPELPAYITLEGKKGELGRGRRSQLQLGYDHRAERRVAVKFLDEDAATSQEHRERFRREAVWLYRIDDERVPQLYTFVDSLKPCIVMEYVAGESLEARIKDESQDSLTPAECQHIGAEVADILFGAHAIGITHRDIKPGNIMIYPDGTDVVDWGIATDRPFWGEEAQSPAEAIGDSLTATNGVVGTLSYMAPEVLQPQPLSPQVDVYGLGATLFHALTGHPPFEAGDAVELTEKQETEDIQPLAELRPDIPAGLCETIDHALAMDPRKRFNPIEFKEALLAVAA